MRHVARAWLVVAGLLSGAVLALGAPAPVAAETPCAPSAPYGVRDVRGQAWSGEVLQIVRRHAPGRGGWTTARISFRVERVYRDRPLSTAEAVDLRPGIVITIAAEGCTSHADLGLRRGDRYLVSTSALHRKPLLLGRNINLPAAWRLDGDRATLVTGMYYRDALGELWPGFAEADTVDEVLAIVAPNAPATDALAGPSPGSGPPWGLALLAGVPAAWLALRRTRRRA